MFKWLREIFKKEKKKPINRCETCVWWAAEEENKVNRHKDPNIRFCDIHKIFTGDVIECPSYKEEKFEAQPDSIQTKEYDLNYEISVNESDSI